MSQEFPIVKLIPSHISLRPIFGLLRLLEFFLLRCLIVQIANVVPAGLRPVIVPIAHTNPAKVMFTIRTLHVIASTVFLDASMAIRAWFSEGLEPSRGCTTI